MKEPLYIVKIGGNIIDQEEKLASFLRAFAELAPSGSDPGLGRKILIHGGGKLATRLAEKLGIEQKILDGRRITDAETLRIVTMVYAGYINKTIVAQLQAQGCNALGLCGADGDAILAHKRRHPVLDYGYVGDIDAVNTDLLTTLLQKNITLVLAPITHDQQGQLLNTNADTIAQEVATSLSNQFDVRLIYCFEKSGVLLNAEDDSTVIPTLNRERYRQLKEKETIFAGMIPKLDNAFAALDRGVSRVIIGKAEQLPRLAAGRAGTTITNDE